MEDLKAKAREAGLWNLFPPESEHGAGLRNVDYAPLCEVMGRSPIGAEPFNGSAPDTGNRETLVRYGTPAQQARWLQPLPEGRTRSAFAMTEPAVALSDATNITARIRSDGNHYVVDARKWWTSGAMDPRCEAMIVMGRTEPQHEDRHRRQSMILAPMATPGVTLRRHAEVHFDGVRVPAEHLLLGEGRGFEIAQGRLGPGRIHHCMRVIGRAERALEAMCRRASARVAFGGRIADQGVTRERIAQARIMIDQTRLQVLHAAWKMDRAGNKAARQQIAMSQVAAPAMALPVIDWAIQAHGGGGVSGDFGLARAWASTRTLRLADGPHEVHRNAIAKAELGRHRPAG